MKEKIYTIPLTQALSENTECLLCVAEKNIAADALAYYTGAAMMEPDVRLETNAAGFCSHHYEKMLAGENKLSTALMLQTRTQEILKHMDTPDTKKGLFAKSSHRQIVAQKLTQAFSSCAVCGRIERHMSDCMSNFIYLLKTQKDFSELFYSSKGLCMKHFAMCSEKCDDKIFEEMLEFEKKRLQSVADENDRFILKFDYRNADMPWENAKNAPERLTKKLRGLSSEI